MAQEETHFDHRKDNAERTENRLSWRDAAEFLCKVRDFDGNIERGKDGFSTLLSLTLSIGGHGFEVEIAGENVVASGLRGRFRTLIETSGNRCTGTSR